LIFLIFLAITETEKAIVQKLDFFDFIGEGEYILFSIIEPSGNEIY
jgi:hypothetical protein